MYLAPLNYDRFFKKVFSHLHIAKAFLQDFLDVEIEEIESLEKAHFLTHESAKLEFDFRCKIKGADIIVDMQQWYKPDVIKRFYLYHCASTVLQLERLPEKKLPISTPDKRAKTKDYRIVSPVLTLVWMVNDNLRFKENYAAYSIAPENAITFLENEALWQNGSIKEIIEIRNDIVKTLAKTDKELDFLPKNRLIFMFQNNIVEDEMMSKYYKWFDFAEKTLNKENEKIDFEPYEKDDIFKEIMLLINEKGLDKSDFDYIETEDEHIELINRTLQGEFIKGEHEGFVRGKDVGFVEGKDVGFVEGQEDVVIRLYKKGKRLTEIADLLDIDLEQINAIIERARKEGKL